MKTQSRKMAVLAAVILTSPIISFAGGQPARYYYTGPKGEVQRSAGRSWDRRALGVKFTVERPKKEQTGSADRSTVAPARTPRSNWGDSAFRK